MSNTPNLDLEIIELTDNIKTTFLNKLNSNNEKIDSAYKVLVDNLLEITNKDNLTDAIEEINNLINNELPEENLELPKVNLELIDTSGNNYSSYITGYWGAINERGELIISAMSGSTDYENIRFLPISVDIGVAEFGFSGSGYATTGSANLPQSCIITGIDITKYSIINVELKVPTINDSWDYVALQVTVVGS